MPLAPGTKLGPYEITAPLGAGGMGEVYRARDSRLGRDVAVKVLPSHLTPSAESRQRFEREARAISQLNHPNICTLHDVGQHQGMDYLVMELLDGESLAQRLERGPLTGDELLRIAIQIAEGLDKAHRQGLTHRDLKPGNVMMTKTGAKLLDFGLARSAGLGPATDLSQSPTMTRPLTAEGSIVGTFQYMAPEQLEGGEADARSDIFAFGAVLYEMATGRKAFEGKSQASLIGSIMKEEPAPVSVVQPMLPPALDRIVKTCLAKDPEDRYQSAHDLKLQLQWVAEAGSQAGVPAPVAARRRPVAWAAWSMAAALAALSAVLGLALMRATGGEPTVIRASILPPKDGSFSLGSLHPGPAAVSPDGRRITFVASEPGGQSMLYVRALDAAVATPLPGTDGAGYPFWSPDSRTIGYFAQGKLRKVEAAGGPPVTLCDATSGKGGTWNADGVIVFAPSFNGPLHRVSAAGGASSEVTALDRDTGENSHRHPWFLPGGRHFIYLARSSRGGSEAGGNAIMLASLDGKEERELLRCQSNVMYASGHLLLLREGTLMAQPFDAKGLKTTGDAFPVAEDVQFLSGAMRGVFSASENGVLVYQGGGGESAGSKLEWRDRKGEMLSTMGEPADYGDPTISPDGRAVSVTIFDARSGTGDLWNYDVARGLRTRFTFDPATDDDAVWSPDGARVAFVSSRKGRFDIYLKSFGGSGAEELVFESQVDKFTDGWSRDGRFLVFSAADPKTLFDIWVLPIEAGGEPTVFLQTEFVEVNPRFSPDGRWIAYQSNESGQFEVYVAPFPGPGRKWQVSLAGGFDPRWRGDGREIFYLSPNGKMMAVETDYGADDFRIGAAQALFDLSRSADYDVTRDGQRFIVTAELEGPEAPPLSLVHNWTAELKK